MHLGHAGLGLLVCFSMANCGGERTYHPDTRGDDAGMSGEPAEQAGRGGSGSAGRAEMQGTSGGSAGGQSSHGGTAAGAGGSALDAGSSGQAAASEGGSAGEEAAGGGGGADPSSVGGDAGAGGMPVGEPFMCGDLLPAVAFPVVLTSTSTAPAAAGGTIADGVYVQTQVVIYGTYSSVPGDVFELRNGFVHRRHTTYSSAGSALTGYEEIGTYAATGAAMARDVTACGLGGGQALWSFTAHPDEMELFTREGSTTWVQTFERQP